MMILSQADSPPDINHGQMKNLIDKRKVLYAFWAFLALALVVNNFLAWVAYSSFERLVIQERGSRLRALAGLASRLVSDDVVALDDLSGQEQSMGAHDALAKVVADRLQDFASSNGLASIVILDLDNRMVVSSSSLDNPGDKPSWSSLYEREILSAWQGKPVAVPPLHQGDVLVQLAFAPVLDTTQVARAILCVEGDGEFLNRETLYIRRLLFGAAVSSIILLLVAGLLFRSLVLSYLEAGEAMARAERLSALGRLVAGVSHEIRNPLSIMTTTCQFLLQDLAEERGDRKSHIALLEDVLGEIDRLDGIVGRFLELARSERAGDDSACVELCSLLKDLAEMLRRELSGKGIELDLLLPGTQVHVGVEPERMRQVVLNLLLNSMDALSEVETAAPGAGASVFSDRDRSAGQSRGSFTGAVGQREGDGGPGRIRIELRSEEADAVLVVVDDGPGFAPEILERPCEPFLSTKASGTGLGLSMVRGVVESMGGSVSLSNASGGGAEVTIRLPLVDCCAGTGDSGDPSFGPLASGRGDCGPASSAGDVALDGAGKGTAGRERNVGDEVIGGGDIGGGREGTK